MSNSDTVNYPKLTFGTFTATAAFEVGTDCPAAVKIIDAKNATFGFADKALTLGANVTSVDLTETTAAADFVKIGTATKAMLGGVADTGITDTEGSMHEHLQFHIRYSLVNGTDFLQRQFPGEHNPCKTHVT